MKDYDETIAFLGQWGLFQQTVFFLLCLSAIPNGFSAFSVIFLADTPAHRCLVPDVNLTLSWSNVIIPKEVVNGREEDSRCWRYRLDVVRNLSNLGYIPGRDVNLTELEQERCVDGWSYSQDVYHSTIVTEFDLVCGDQWKQPFSSSVYFLGVLSGSFFSGQLSDKFGRKPVLFATMGVQTVFTFLTYFSPSWPVFSILFFIVGLGQISNYVAAFVLGSEILTGSVRVLFSSLGVCLFFAIGYMMLPLFAYFIRDWKTLVLTLSLPGLVYIPLWWLIPESPRWLITKGRVKEAETILREAARKNHVTPPLSIFQNFNTGKGEKQSKAEDNYNLLDLFKTNNIRNTTLILCLVWFTLSTGYFGLSLKTSSLHGDRFVNCFISAAIEVPAYVIGWLALHYAPRRLSASTSMLMGGFAVYFIQVAPPEMPGLSLGLEMLGKFGITTGTALMFVYSGELFPTVLRSTALGVCATLSRVGSTIAPYFIHLSVYYAYLPYILLGSLAMLSAMSVVFLPETFGRPLPETIQQMHHRERPRCLWSFSKPRSSSVVPSAEQRPEPTVLMEEIF